jgi:hypothetical protein
VEFLSKTLTYEFKRFLRNWVVLSAGLVMLAASFIFIQVGIADYKGKVNRKARFQQLERLKVSQYQNYRYYGSYGFQSMYSPPVFYILCANSGVCSEMKGFVDSSWRLGVDQPLIGPNLFKPLKFPFTDFSGVILFFGSLMAMFFTCDAMRSPGFMRMLSSMVSPARVFLCIIASRTIIMFLFLLFVIAAAWFQVIINGLYIPIDMYFFYFILQILLVSLFFIALGTAAGMLKTMKRTYFVMFTCWFTFLFIAAAIFMFYASYRSQWIKPLEQLELEKLKLVMEFEKRAVQSNVTLKIEDKLNKPAQEYMSSFYKNEFVKTQALEDEMRSRMKATADELNSLSVIFPTTFYISSTCELSGMGYSGMIDFYRFVHDLKKKFFKFYFEKVYVAGEGAGIKKIESFVKGDDDVLKGQSHFMGLFLAGVVISLAWSFLLFGFAYFKFRERLFRIPDIKVKWEKPVRLEFQKGDLKVLDTRQNILLTLLYDLFSGEHLRLKKKGFDMKVTIDGEDIAASRGKVEFLYVPQPKSLPGNIGAENLLLFLGRVMNLGKEEIKSFFPKTQPGTGKKNRLGKLDILEKEEILVSILRMFPGKIVMINDAAISMTVEYSAQIKESIQGLKEKNGIAIYLTENSLFLYERRYEDTILDNTKGWTKMIDDLKSVLKP